MSRAFFLLLSLALTIGLSATDSAVAQQNLPNFGEGTHYLRAIINKFNLKPIPQGEFAREMEQAPQNILLVVLGKTASLDRFADAELGKFVVKGGALLVASDQETHAHLETEFGVRIAGQFLVVPAGSDSAYKGLPDCPIVSDFASVRHPIFQGITGVATNRPAHLVRPGSRIPVLAWFPAETHWEDADRYRMERNFKRRQWIFAAGGDFGHGRVLVLSDHSVFINDMLRQPDNQNLIFAYNCIDWLTDHGKRNRVYFLEDGKVVTNFNVALKEPPPPILPPLPPEEQLIDKGNEILAGLDDSDVINRFINERVRHDSLLRAALMIGTGLLCMWGLWRLTQNRHRFDRHEPVLATCMADQGTNRTLVDRRKESLLRQNNCWEVAHQEARQCFASLLEAPGGPRASPIEIRPNAPPQLTAQGSWWQRRRMKRTVLRLWRLASGRYPERITPGALRRIEEELATVRAAVANGSLQLSDGARTA